LTQIFVLVLPVWNIKQATYFSIFPLSHFQVWLTGIYRLWQIEIFKFCRICGKCRRY